MAKTDGEEKGYVYILTNPSFREDWIKIGKSSRPVDVRSKELDNTAVPLPFEIYATMKTASYNKVEAMLHKFLQKMGVRIRNNREFFNVKPETALEAFSGIAELLPDAELFINGNTPTATTPETNHEPKTRAPRKRPTNTGADVVEVHSTEELQKGARYSLDGEHFVSMAKFAFVFVKQLLEDSSLTFSQLEALLPRTMLNGFEYCGVVARKGVVDTASYPIAAKQKAYHHGDPNYLLTASDGVVFYTTTQWERSSFKKLLAIAETRGYSVFTQRK